MEPWIAAAATWLAFLCLVVRLRYGLTLLQWCAAIKFKRADAVSPHQLFGYLLSANLAVLEQDDFNQLGSAHSTRRIRDLLELYWRIHSSEDLHRVLQYRLAQLGLSSPEEHAAYDAWRNRNPIDTETYAALLDVCVFLSVDAGVVKPREISDRHLQMMAWDIQQAAYILRLGFALGYVTREFAESNLSRLQREARIHYTSWKDYSISSLVGRGLRARIDLFDPGDWQRIAQSHAVLTATHSPIAHAAPWGRPGFWLEVQRKAVWPLEG
jgi:hypothetical protein